MTEQQFDARLQVIEEQTAARQERVDGYRDQHMAALFVESDWSQEKLAAHLSKRWGKDVARQWVEKHLRFGRFLQFFATTGSKDEWKIPLNLTERAFRRFWEATEPAGDFRGHKANSKAALLDERRPFPLCSCKRDKDGSKYARRKNRLHHGPRMSARLQRKRLLPSAMK